MSETIKDTFKHFEIILAIFYKGKFCCPDGL
jgi:hypothetical protein